jgi:ankyrin repeat domain-containing protein 50
MQRDLRRWLSPPDPWKNHNIACDAHLDGTATWFLESDAFAAWKSSGFLLWIRGKRMCLPPF